MKHYRLLPLLALAAVALTATPGAAQNLYNTANEGGGASKTAPQTCDPDYWNSMSAKAWMEAEREIIQNKSLIYKPDSVLEYVCFDSFMQQAARDIGNIFTHTTYYNGQMIIPRGDQSHSLEHTLTKAVTNSYKTYITSNFGHEFLGGRSRHLGRHAAANRSLGDASAMGDYKCALMANIWTQAKCENFIDNAGYKEDGFYPFDDLEKGPDSKEMVQGYKSKTDPRIFPAACKIAKPDNTKGNATWPIAINQAANKFDQMYDMAKPLKKTYDEIRPKLKPGKCTGSGNKAILTGVTVITDASGKGGYDDGVCSNPGCSFKKGGTCVP